MDAVDFFFERYKDWLCCSRGHVVVLFKKIILFCLFYKFSDPKFGIATNPNSYQGLTHGFMNSTL